MVIKPSFNLSSIINEKNYKNRYSKFENILKKCHKCIKNNENFNIVCKECPAIKYLTNLKILSPEETLDELIYNNKSISRFGDGEFKLIFNKGIYFQKSNTILSERLKEIIKSEDEKLLVGINNSLNCNNIKLLREKSKRFWKKYIKKNKFHLIKLFDIDKIYGSSNISRFYIDYKNHNNVPKYLKRLKTLWSNKSIVIIEGEKSRLGVGNDLFNNTSSIERILCPAENAFDLYNKIFEEATKINKNKLILIALGPTATVLAYDLSKLGYQAIDIGHVDIEYEWYLKNVTNKIVIKNKYVNEIYDGRINIEDINDEKYYKQVIAKILN